ncbi:response regulator [Hymenobacter sp. 5516J-16]|uniref:sigma-54-dependent transcriptional regulator n=1 Tax=Hymenobacter sp. 5516J-16 TaxID=2932253 RepID=UPI001FCFAC0F|nr:response regulator [Hymenobacter sp. 5516J-16]UOQ77284.1 response regulator [Hymenobacter sp. 5516J-16]
MPTGTLLLIDDEARLRQLLARVLELEGYSVLQAPDASRGLELLQQHANEVLVVVSDVKLPDAHGVDLIPRLKAKAPDMEIVLLTAFGTIPDGVRAMKQGAFDYLTKGDFEQQLVVVVERAAEKARLRRRVAELERRMGQRYSFESMIGAAPTLRRAQDLARQVAPTDSTVLLEGPRARARNCLPRPSTRPVSENTSPSWL